MLLKRFVLAAAIAALAPAAVAADDAPRLPVEDFRPLLVKAIDSSDRAAFGILIGPMSR